MNFLQRAGAAIASTAHNLAAGLTGRRVEDGLPQSGYNNATGKTGGFSSVINLLRGLLPGSTRDWEAEAGNVWDNSAVSICLRWFSNTFCEAPFAVKESQPDGTYIIQQMHPLAMRIKRPNKHFTRTQLFKATLLSYFADGNGYWFKRRSGAQKVVELWWIPHWMIEPRWSDDPEDWLPGGDEFISYYEYMVDGTCYYLAPRDIVHFRQGVDPANRRKGYAPLRALLKEICTDNQILTYTYGIVKNCGVPAVILTPKDKGVSVDDKMATKTKATWKANNSSDKAAGVMVMSTPWDVNVLGLSPEDLAIDKIGEVSEARIAACFGLPPVAVSLLVGLKTATAKASHAESLKQAYQSGIMPVQREFCEWIDLQLLPELGNENTEYTAFDLSEVEALSENRNELYKRNDASWDSGNMTLNEVRAAKGQPADPDTTRGEKYKWELMPAIGAFGAPAQPGEDPDKPDPAKEVPTEEEEDEDDKPVDRKKLRKLIGDYWRSEAKRKAA